MKKDRQKASVPMEQEQTQQQQNPKSDVPPLTETHVKNMILEHKVDVAKWQINLVLFFFVVLGIMYPIWTSYNLEAKFKELAGMQLRKPEIECRVNGEPLLNSILLSDDIMPIVETYIDITNIGDGVSSPIRAYLYLANSQADCVGSRERMHSEKAKYPLKYCIISAAPLYPKEVNNIEIRVDGETGIEVDAMFVVHYGDTKPLEVPFRLKYVNKNPNK